MTNIINCNCDIAERLKILGNQMHSISYHIDDIMAICYKKYDNPKENLEWDPKENIK